MRSFFLTDESRELRVVLPNGIYLLELKSETLTILRKVLLLR
ncbi:MAG: hypothetical protein ABIK99_06710 [candidate division WOR-3 bacterium]